LSIVNTYTKMEHINPTSNTNYIPKEGTFDIPRTSDALIALLNHPRHPEPIDVLIDQCESGNLENVKLLIDVCNVNPICRATFNKEYTPTERAIAGGHIEVFKYLCTRTILVLSPKNKMRKLKGCLINAIRYGNLDIVKYIFSLGYIDHKTPNWRVIAAQNGHRDVLEYLLTYYA